MIVGLTGGIGTGKSTVCGIFKHLGVPIISADAISHNILETNKSVFQAVIHKFGPQFLTPQHTIDRAKLRNKVFVIPEDRLWLESLVHPLIEQEIIRQAKSITYPYCVAEIPLLIEAKMQNVVDRILTIDCGEEMQLKHALQRNIHSEAEIRAIIAAQISREKRLAVSNDIIENTGNMPNLIKQIEDLHQLYLSLAS